MAGLLSPNLRPPQGAEQPRFLTFRVARRAASLLDRWHHDRPRPSPDFD